MAFSNQQILDALREAMHAIATGTMQSASEGARRYEHLNPLELEAVIEKYERKVAQESGRRWARPVKRVNI